MEISLSLSVKEVTSCSYNKGRLLRMVFSCILFDIG
jgi:hypothetical protein